MGELKAGWKRVKIGDVVERHVERTDDIDSYPRFVGVDHLDSENLRLRRYGDARNEALPPTFRYVFRDGMVLVPTRRPRLRKCAVASFNGLTGEKVLVLKPCSTALTLSEFLPHLLSSPKIQDWNIEKEVGSVTPYFRWVDMAEFEFALPSIEDQRRITATLNASQRVLECLDGVVLNSEAVVSAVRTQVFNGASTKPLSELVERIEAGSSPSGLDQAPTDGQLGVIRVSAVGRLGFMATESKALVAHDTFEPTLAVHRGDLLITRANTAELVGMSCLVEEDHPNLMLSDKTLRLLAVPWVSPKYLLEALWSADVRRQLRASATGSGAAMKNISQAKLLELRLPWLAEDKATGAVERVRDAKRGYKAARQRASYAKELHYKLVNSLTDGTV